LENFQVNMTDSLKSGNNLINNHSKPTHSSGNVDNVFAQSWAARRNELVSMFQVFSGSSLDSLAPTGSLTAANEITTTQISDLPNLSVSLNSKPSAHQFWDRSYLPLQGERLVQINVARPMQPDTSAPKTMMSIPDFGGVGEVKGLLAGAKTLQEFWFRSVIPSSASSQSAQLSEVELARLAGH
jgi:hypothetical protein